MAAMRASRLLSCAALAASVAVLIGQVSNRAWLMSRASGAVRACCSRWPRWLVSARPRWAHGVGQALALLSCVIAFGPLLAESFGASSSALPPATRALLERILPAGSNMAGATGIMFAATAMAVFFTPLRTRFATHLFAAAASLGLLAMATSLIGVLLGQRGTRQPRAGSHPFCRCPAWWPACCCWARWRNAATPDGCPR